MKLCLGCMEKYEDTYMVCPHCGYIVGEQENGSLQLNPGNILKGENSTYTIGRAIGQGGFGITYIAWDNLLERKVAIKEYFPSEFSTRRQGSTLVEITYGKNEFFNTGMEKFIDEARKLAKFTDEEGIVRIYDHIYTNETAYIVMEYLEGITLSKYIEDNKKIAPKKAVEMLMPIMKSLEEVHKEGIIHRDIAPDNIIVLNDGRCKLIDFGAARVTANQGSKSLSVMIKQGYSPEEQYSSNNPQGTYTDVYAMAATLYKMMTGITPVNALKRRAELENKNKNVLIPIERNAKKLPKNIKNAIYNALNLKIEDRTQNMEQFIAELTAPKAVPIKDQTIPLIDRLGWKKWQIAVVSITSVLVVTLVVLLATGVIRFSKPLKEDVEIPDGMTRVPALVNQELSSAEKLVSEGNLLYMIEGKEYSALIPKDYVLSQSEMPGNIINENTMIMLKISGGVQTAEVPALVGYSKEEAEKKCKEAGFEFSYTETYSNVIESGCVIEQTEEVGSLVAIGSTINVIVSKGRNPEEEMEDKKVIVPNFVGKTYDEVIGLAEEIGLMINVSEKRYSSEYAVNVVMEQSIEGGTEINSGEEVALVISLGIELISVPDVTKFTEDEAKGLLESIKLKYKISYSNSENIKAGLVISQKTQEGEKVAPGTVVELVVSKGSGKFDMINVIGKTESKAKSELSALGLIPSVSYANSESVAEGTVISQNPESGIKVSKGETVTIVVSSGKKAVTVTYNANGGTCSQATTKLYQGNTFGTLPTPTRDYYTFNGWYTAASGGSKVTSTTKVTGAQTLYAQWTANTESGWVLASKVPAGAKITNTKWTYTLTETETIWTSNGNGSVQWADFPAGYSTNDQYYLTLQNGKPQDVINDTTKRVYDTAKAEGWIYWHWMYALDGKYGATDRIVSNKSGKYKVVASNGSFTGNYTLFGAFQSTTNYSVSLTNSLCGETIWKVTDRTSFADTQGSYWWFRFEYYTSTYTDYVKTYDTKTTNKESTTEITAGGNISNVQKYVKYIPK